MSSSKLRGKFSPTHDGKLSSSSSKPNRKAAGAKGRAASLKKSESQS
eukprot:CAMPEP_0176107928 /NCGR_PEP_ID=MMETSP0120_2-20121206/54170_1 /TAXON_ID=160619 /ORGANISM="Kryptoperidinium foliaceum, Strain CCMP 1326" /LENGTH=46 /DNA_ID= /DNA_START= /DNA_END= /DNA_ORIENTATION=